MDFYVVMEIFVEVWVVVNIFIVVNVSEVRFLLYMIYVILIFKGLLY